MRIPRTLKITLIISLLAIWGKPVYAGALVFESTQLSPATEASKMRKVILKDFTAAVDFLPNDNQFRLLAKGVGVLGGMHGDFAGLTGTGGLDNVDDILSGLSDRKFSPALLDLGRGGDDEQHYIPWMQATYVMAANRKALAYLPKGADINRLTYNQLIAWGAAIKAATGEAKVGLPLGANGLIHRFIQGYLLPAYTGGMVRGFRSQGAHDMWQMVRRLWPQIAPNATDYSEMGNALLNDDAWVVWDHTARLKIAFDERPDDFVAFPAPAGPRGRAFMAVLAGLAIPDNSPDRAAAAKLIEYLTRPRVQAITLSEVGFFPVVEMDAGAATGANTGLASLQQAVSSQSSAEDSRPVLLPIGLGDQGGAFNTVYKLTFSQIVMRGRDVGTVLDRQSARLNQIISASGAPCWPPDQPSTGPCPVE